MEDEQWKRRDFTQIKPRRPEGTAVAEFCADWESTMSFLFLWPPGESTNFDGKDQTEVDGVTNVEDSDKRSYEVQAGRDRVDGSEVKQLSSEELLKEFEFSSMSTSSSAVVEHQYPSGSSPADELFFKGQLLPLHLPPRIQMVKKLSLDGQQQWPQELKHLADPAGPDCRNQCEDTVTHGNPPLSQARFARLFQPKHNSREVSVPVSDTPNLLSSSSTTWWDPRELAQENAGYTSSRASFTSTDRDSSGECSSSRDSSGSSQDGFDSGKETLFTASRNLESKWTFMHNREVFSTHSTVCDHRRRPIGISTWLRPPFKWKVLFGAKKSSLLKPLDVPMDVSATSTQDVGHLQDANQPNEQFSSDHRVFFSSSPASSDHRYYSDCSGELAPSGDLLLNSGASVHGVGVEQDKHYYHRSMEKVKGYVHRYMKVLQKKTGSQGDCADQAPGSTHSLPTPAITNTRSFPPFTQSFRFSAEDMIPLCMIRKPPQPPVPSVRRRPSTSCSSSELHSAIQGAIAHCKESQSKKDDA